MNWPSVDDWRPTANPDTLKLRADLLARVRTFFAQRDVLEVETPALASTTVTDLHIKSLQTRCALPGENLPRALYLQTSPEFAMKRLLAAGSGPIFQICRAFRDGEAGELHNPEFTLLEWYRPGFDHHALIDEVDVLLSELLGLKPGIRLTYAEAFRQHAGIDPFEATTDVLHEHAVRLGAAGSLDRDACLDLILCGAVQPKLGAGAVYLDEYPPSLASLARVRPGNPSVAERFELFVDGIEIANGYHEMNDCTEQRQRFDVDLDKRKRLGLDVPTIDERLLSALAHGMPDCAGVALGVDRLVMLAAGLTTIQECMAFPVSRV